MRALFCYDGPLQYDKNRNYYSTVINNTVFNRYLKHADFLKVAIRTEPFLDDSDSKKSKKIDTSNVEIISIPSLSNPKGFIFERKNVNLILRKQLLEVDFAIIRLPSFIGEEAVKVARKLNKPYLVEVVGCPWDSLWNYGLKGKIMAPYLTLSMKRQVKRAPFLIYVTSTFLQERYPNGGRNTNCSNVEINDVEKEVLDLRLKHILKNNDKIVLGTTAAVNVPYKGQQYVIEALAQLKKQGINNFEYQMVGGGDQSRLKKIIHELGMEKEVFFLGVKTQEQVFDWLDYIDIYVQPSRQEGLPRALIEAMSRGLPCIGARTGGIPELLSSDRIFSNTKNNINEICQLIQDFDKDRMIDDAIRNFEESKDYIIEKITLRRNEMLNLLINSINK